MGEKLSTLIQEFKNEDKVKFLLIVEKMKPLMNKYVRLLYKDEREDMYSEFVLYLLESIIKMNYYKEEGQCVYFLSNAIRNKFYELYKKSRRNYDNKADTNENFDNIYYEQSEYENIITRQDLSKFVLNAKGKQYQILNSIIFEDETDIEISKKFNISRQYVNRVRRKFYNLLKEEYFSLN